MLEDQPKSSAEKIIRFGTSLNNSDLIECYKREIDFIFENFAESVSDDVPVNQSN